VTSSGTEATKSGSRAVVLRVERLQSPVGDLLVYSTPEAVCALDFADLAGAIELRLRRRYGRFATCPGSGSEASRCIGAYFSGDICAIDTVAIDSGGTPFQRDVWQAMRRVPPGASRTYSWLAQAVGRQAAVRAVGGASSSNPIALIIPCHRIVGVGGSLVGYAGGVERKRWLLDHERAAAQSARER
jgi:methylated-DNA-[protein]-cysteine S-methyltransferase